MDDARERLIEAFIEAEVSSDDEAIDTMLSCPDIILELMVEEGLIAPSGYCHAQPTGMAPYVATWEKLGPNDAQLYRRGYLQNNPPSSPDNLPSSLEDPNSIQPWT